MGEQIESVLLCKKYFTFVSKKVKIMKAPREGQKRHGDE